MDSGLGSDQDHITDGWMRFILSVVQSADRRTDQSSMKKILAHPLWTRTRVLNLTRVVSVRSQKASIMIRREFQYENINPSSDAGSL